jgi:hypothetical protein
MAIENLKYHVILALLIFSYSFLAIESQQKERWRTERERERERERKRKRRALLFSRCVGFARPCRDEDGEETMSVCFFVCLSRRRR